MHKYILSLMADYDVDDITDCTLEVWGESQILDYLTNLLICFKTLALNCELGGNTAEFTPMLKRFNYKAHTIFYEQTENGIFVVRILNQRQDFEHHL